MANFLWSPNHQDRFIILGQDLRLYEFFGKETKLLAVNSDTNHMKTIAWSPLYSDLLAIGYTTGITALAKFKSFQYGLNDDLGFSVLDSFLPKHTRACNVVEFNPVQSQLLLSGLEKVRNDYGLFVYDTAVLTSRSEQQDTPITQFAQSEGVNSATWMRSSQRIAAGLSLKSIRLFDIRGACIFYEQKMEITRQ